MELPTTRNYDKAFQQIRELDKLFVQASESNDPQDWANYKAKVAQFQKENDMSRIVREERREAAKKTRLAKLLGTD